MIIRSWVPTLGLVKKLETLLTVPPSSIYPGSNSVLPPPLPSPHLSFLAAKVFQLVTWPGLVSTPASDSPWPHSPSRPSLPLFSPLLTPLGLHWFSSSPSNVLCLFLFQSLWTSFLSACNALPPDLCMAHSFIPSKILSKCHLLSDACSCPRSPNRPLLALFPSTALSTSHHTIQSPYLLFIVCLPLECKF